MSHLVRWVGNQFGYDVCLRSVELVSLDESDNSGASRKKSYEGGFTGSALYEHTTHYLSFNINMIYITLGSYFCLLYILQYIEWVAQFQDDHY